MENSIISLRLKKIDQMILATLALLALALIFVQYGNFDVWLQNKFFDFAQKKWLVDKTEPVAKFFFYQFPKMLFSLAIIGCLLVSLFSKTKNRRKFILIFLGFALIPLIAGNVKKFTNVYCPAQLEIYGGAKPYIKIFSSYPQDFKAEKRGQCFPAGHAVTGFALLILFFALEKKSNRVLGFCAAIIFGWAMGTYQMLKGAHFFGDTLIAMLLCFLIAAILARINEVQLAKTLPKN